MRAQLTRFAAHGRQCTFSHNAARHSVCACKKTKPRYGKQRSQVEDNDHFRKILASILRFSGYQVSEAATGSEAIDKARLVKPSLILLDLSLPDMSGIDAARAIKKNRLTTEIPIIACSAYSREQEMEDAFRAGIVDYLQKPIPTALIKAKIQEFILS
jgi:CheY-like chemotaxis protein